jgi:formate hydrogenlyase subunit 6/NADH:ubiquinone oxidoreductase subunit I
VILFFPEDNMPKKDLYEDLIRYYEFQIGVMPRRAEFKAALESTFPEEDLRIFFQMPYLGFISEEKLKKKLLNAGMNEESFTPSMQRLIPKGLVDKYTKKGVWGYERAPVIVVLEMTVREPDDSPFRHITALVMNDLIEGAAETIPTRTPYYRVLPVEKTIQADSASRLVEVNAEIPDPRQILPLDVISEMIKGARLIALSNCYCRSAKEIIGEPCGHPLETCFYFDELAEMKLQTEYARQVDYDEAMRVLYECETHGLVHNVSNCEDKIQTLCNCCDCSCGVLKAWNRGLRNTTAPSRFVIALDAAKCTLQKDCVEICPANALAVVGEKLQVDTVKCLGCGLCVPACPENALHLEMRPKPSKVYKTNNALFNSIYAESAVALVGRKLGLGK